MDFMTVSPTSASDITVRTLYDIFDVSEEEGPGRLVYQARQAHYTLPFLVLSALQREGQPMGPAAAGELARARRRAEHYRNLVAELPGDLPYTVMKGPALAAAYPPGVLRPQGDVDLIVPDERQLWRAVRELSARSEPDRVWVTVVGPEHHLLVTLVWPPEEPLLDPEHRVELSTAGLLGDFGAVPVRVRPPADPTLSALVCLAEERLQRRFHPRDALDLYALAGQADGPSGDEIVDAAARMLLAPELVELITYTAELLPVDRFTGLLPRLEEAAEAERARRAGTEPGPEPTGVRETLAAGGPVHGIALGSPDELRGLETARVHWYGDEALLLTPVGAYLLVCDAVVPRERHAGALEELDRLREGGIPGGIRGPVAPTVRT